MKRCIHRIAVAACVIGSLLNGCAVIGPSSIHSGRLTYNEAISETNNQQMLMVLIHNRYAEERSTPLRDHKSENNMLPDENGAQYDQAHTGAKAETTLALKCPLRSVVWG